MDKWLKKISVNKEETEDNIKKQQVQQNIWLDWHCCMVGKERRSLGSKDPGSGMKEGFSEV